MALNKNAFLRYILIDKCIRELKNPTIADFINAIADGNDGTRPSLRSVQLDIQEMRQNQSLKLFAPIVFERFAFKGKKEFSPVGYYRYADAEYTLLKAIEKGFYRKPKL